MALELNKLKVQFEGSFTEEQLYISSNSQTYDENIRTTPEQKMILGNIQSIIQQILVDYLSNPGSNDTETIELVLSNPTSSEVPIGSPGSPICLLECLLHLLQAPCIRSAIGMAGLPEARKIGNHGTYQM